MKLKGQRALPSRRSAASVSQVIVVFSSYYKASMSPIYIHLIQELNTSARTDYLYCAMTHTSFPGMQVYQCLTRLTLRLVTLSST
jgi:hypothetical protein